MDRKNVTRFCTQEFLEDFSNLQQLIDLTELAKKQAQTCGVAYKDVKVYYNEDDSEDSRGVLEVSVSTLETDVEFNARLEKQIQHDNRIKQENEEADHRLYLKLKSKFENKE